MRKKTKLIIFSAPSGAGKTTLVRYLMSKMPNLAFSISATSRKARKNEKDGKDYYFISVDEFKKKICEGAFVEWEEVYENQFYGTLIAEVERLRKLGKSIVFDVDVKGGLNIKRLYGDDALAIFVRPPSLDMLEQRLLMRSTEDGESLRKRLERVEEELLYASKFDVVVVNDNLQKAKKEVEKIARDFFSDENN